MDRERSPRRCPKDRLAHSQMSWRQQERPTIMQLSHLQWNANPTLMRPFGGLWGPSQAPPPPAHAQQQTAVAPYIPPDTSARGMFRFQEHFRSTLDSMGQIHRLELQEAHCWVSRSCYSASGSALQGFPQLLAARHCGRQTHVFGRIQVII